MIDIKQILDDYNIHYDTEGKNTQRGWINVNCPFCEDPSNHGGFNLSGQYYNCWQCGAKKLDRALSSILESDLWQTRKIMDEYETGLVIKQDPKKTPKANQIEFPKGTISIKSSHRIYLLDRDYTPGEIERIWYIKGTGHLGNYKHRIIIPIYLNNKIVSFTSRDITGKAILRYKACAIEDEVIHHKHICYGSDYIRNRRAIIVEGPLDVWRIGPGAIATFGTSFTPQQILFISEIIDEAFILYDRGAEKEAKKLYYNLTGLIKHVEIVSLPGKYKDPGEMKRKDVNILKKSLNF